MKIVVLLGWFLVAMIGVFIGATVQDEGARIAAFAAAGCAAAVAVFELVAMLRKGDTKSRAEHQRENRQPED